MQFKVPQFIEIEDKVIGPLSFKQFIYVAGGVSLIFLAYIFLPIYISFIVIPAIFGLTFSLAFYKVNNRPFIHIMEAAFFFFFRRKLYLWQKLPGKKPEVAETKPAPMTTKVPELKIPNLSEGRLKELAWSLDIKENIGQ